MVISLLFISHHLLLDTCRTRNAHQVHALTDTLDTILDHTDSIIHTGSLESRHMLPL